MTFDKKRYDAHRFSWALHFGPIPAGAHVLHHCDTRLCVRPEHLFLGTHSDNMRDMVSKGRAIHQTNPERLVRGERLWKAKLTDERVRQIRQRHQNGERVSALAVEYGVHWSTLYKMLNREIWQHVSP